ncbi:hypothetical protein NQ317_015660, partial [Molorchus minor]
MLLLSPVLQVLSKLSPAASETLRFPSLSVKSFKLILEFALAFSEFSGRDFESVIKGKNGEQLLAFFTGSSMDLPTGVRGIDCDCSRNDPSTPDFSRTLPKPKTTVFGVFAHIFRSKESIATIPEMIRALPTLPKFSRFFPNSPEMRGIDCDYSRKDPSPPDFSRTLPKPKTTVFG